MLYIISTPIGNLLDITFRAIDVLNQVDIIVAEDTRSTGRLLKYYNIPKKPYISYNDYNAAKKIPSIINNLREGKEIALVSENGTPAVSDPGFKLIRECIKNDIRITPVPGASAFLPALISSGFPTDKFTFYGFLPKSQKKKLDVFEEAKNNSLTGIFYESPHRIVKTLQLLNKNYPEEEIFIGREITKKFEEFLRGRPHEVLERIKPKGELVLIINFRNT
ncbi:MAG: 16S rRNA (cytidine(1402)-2'-O)-methyltransferase [Candidatus Nanoarchaeia archaeon]